MPRRATATAIKILTGNPGRRPLNTNEPIPDALAEDIPDVLIDPSARAEWQRGIVPNIRTGQITAADYALAVLHCQLWSQYRHQLAAGRLRPALDRGAQMVIRSTLDMLIRVDAMLGFSPTSRTHVQAAKPQTPAAAAANPLTRFMKQG